MIYTGYFNNHDNTATYNVTIGNTGVTYPIQDPSEQSFYESGKRLVFSDTPVTITADRQDLLKRIIISQCTIYIHSNDNLSDDLFADTNRQIPVTITKEEQNPEDDEILFFGYVDPMQFDQGYNYHWEEVQVCATDPLGALEERTVDKLSNVNESTILSPKALLDIILDDIGVVLGTRIVNTNVWNAFNNTKINMMIFFGESEDDRYTLYDTLETILKYFNMYIAMKGDQAILTCTINQEMDTQSISGLATKITESSTSLSVDEAFSQVNLTCDIEPVKNSIIKFDDDDSMHSKYQHMERYMTEIVCPGNGHHAHDAFTSLVLHNNCDYDASYVIDNYFYLLENSNFDFGPNGYTNQNFTDQREALLWLAADKFRGAFVGFGRGNKIKNATSDNSPVNSISLDKWLLISCMGEFDNTDTNAQVTIPNKIQAAQPICSYTPLTSYILSPTDTSVTNYLIISCSILLNPLQFMTGRMFDTNEEKIQNTYEMVYNIANQGHESEYWHHTVPNPDNGDGAYYTQKWDPWDYGTSLPSGYTSKRGVYGDLNNSKNQMIGYDYTKTDDNSDIISKLPILACQLKVGEKYCVERLDLGEAGIGIYEWLTQEQCTNLGAEPYFTIGIDPKIGDNIVGQTFKIQNNIDYTMSLDTSGTAIPINMSDELAGQVEFKILGPYNLIYDELDKHVHHKFLFWRCTHWHSRVKVILDNIQSIMIKDLKLDVKSNNGLRSQYATTQDNDLVYASNVNNRFIEKLEDSISICTGLTLEECEQFGIKSQISNSYVLNADNTFFRGFGSGLVKTKAEVCLVDYLYKEYSTPAKMMTINVDTGTIPNGQFGNQISTDMLHTALSGIYPNNNYFTIMTYTTDLKKESIEVTLRESQTYTNTQI